jgi:hypothetical protein
MTIKKQLFQEIESTPEELLEQTLDFLRFLKTKQIKTQTELKSNIHKSFESTGRSLLEHLKTIGTWEGDDAQLCLERVYTTRGKVQFDQPNPFDE